MSEHSSVRTMDPGVVSDIATVQSSWYSLYKVGGVAALIATVLFLSDIVVLAVGGTAPASVNEWFTLLQNDRTAGLLQLFFTDLIGIVLLAPIAMALYAVLRRTNAAYTALATTLVFAAIAIIVASNSNYALIHLSDQYAAATSEAQRSQLLAAAESVLATGTQGTGILVGGLLVEGALVIFSVIMLGGTPFGKGIAYLGIVAHGLDLLHAIVFLLFIPVLNADTATAIGVPLLVIGGTLQLIWYPLVGWRLLQLRPLESTVFPQQS